MVQIQQLRNDSSKPSTLVYNKCAPFQVPIASRPKSHSRPGVLDGDRGRARRHRSQHTAVLLHVDDGRAGRALRAAGKAGGHAGERDRSPVGEGDEGVAFGEVLDDPLRVLLAERGLAGERVRHRLAGGVVDERRGATRQGSRDDRGGDRVAGAEAEPGEVVREVREPLEPGWCSQQAMNGSAMSTSVAEGYLGKEAYRRTKSGTRR